MKQLSYEDRLKNAALEGVILRLKNDQPYYVVRFMKKCSVPEVICTSKEVKELAIQHFTKGFDHEYTAVCFGARKNLKTALELLKAVQISDAEITKIILDYFEEYRKKYWGRLPRDFGHILQAYPIPVEVLNKNKKLQESVLAEVTNGRFNDDHFSYRMSVLKYFSIPREAVAKLVGDALSNFAFNKEDEPELDKFVKMANLNHGEMLAILTGVISELISEGNTEEMWVLVNKYSVDPRLFLNEQNKKAAIKGVLRKLSLGDAKESEEARQIIKSFGLVRADFEDKDLEKVISEKFNRGGIEHLLEMLAFADWPRETTTNFLRSKLDDLLRLETEKLKALTSQYDIGWEEVVETAKKDFIRGLAGSGRKYLKSYIEKYDFSREFLMSEEVVSAAKEGLLVLYKYADHDDSIGFLTETFGIS